MKLFLFLSKVGVEKTFDSTSEKGIDSLPPEILTMVMIKNFGEEISSPIDICSPDLHIPLLERPGISHAGLQELE